MTQNLKASIIQIRDVEGYVHGSGFLIDANTAVTCAHVVEAAGAAPGQSVTIAFALTGDTCPAEIPVETWRPADEDDITILHLQGELPTDVSPAILGPSNDTAGHSFRAFGYPEVGNIQGVWAEGKILGPITDDQNTTMLQLRSQEITEGMSGGPVLDTNGDRVVGMVNATYYPLDKINKLRDLAFATPIEVIAKVWPSIKLISLSPPTFHRPMFGKPFQAPPLPPHFVPRPEVTDALKGRLLNDESATPGILVISAIHGLGGIGKSVLAAALAHDSEIQERFSDGILWATLGQEPDLLSLLSGWIQALGDYDFHPITIEGTSAHLRALLQDKAILLVVDDVWNPEHALPFRTGGPQSQILITTRRADVAEEVGASPYEMHVMTPEQSLKLFSARLEHSLVGTDREEAMKLAKVVGYLPLALELIAVRVKRGVSWAVLRGALEQEIAQLEILGDRRSRRKEHTRLEATFSLSLNVLRDDDEEAWQAFVWLGILPEDVQIIAPMTATLWEIDETEATDLLEVLWNDALLLPGPPLLVEEQKFPSYRLHDLLHDIARRLLTTAPPQGLGFDLPDAHITLLERYRKRTSNGLWHILTNDGYIHAYLTWHMERANQIRQIHGLLREQRIDGRNGWYQARERLGQIAGFLADVTLAWSLVNKELGASHSPLAIGLQCRYALITASVNNLAKNLHPALLAALVEDKIWTSDQGLAYARQVPGFRQRLEALTGLIHHLQEPLKGQTL